jgi:hypothetical protein
MQPEAGSTPQRNIELMPKKEILHFQLASRPEQVGDQRRRLLGAGRIICAARSGGHRPGPLATDRPAKDRR